MSKRTYKILRFDGGINNDADARDIGDNQFAELQNVAVDEMGKIIVLGDVQTQRKDLAGNITGQGNGLFACSTDHTGFLNDGVTPAAPGQTYYLVEDGNTIRGIGENGETATIACTIGDKGPAMYYVDGALRIADADVYDGGEVPVWRGYISPKTYCSPANDSIASVAEQWATQDSEIAGAFEVYQEATSLTYHCKNALMGNNGDSSPDFYNFNNGSVTTLDADYNGGATATGASGQRWGFCLEFDEDDDGNGTGTWMPTTTTRYKFYITTMYDNHTQESLPQLLQMWGSDLLHTDDDYDGATVQSELKFTNGETHNETGENIALYLAPVVKVNYNDGTLYNFGADAVGATTAVGNPRISGLRVYWASNEDGYTTLWQIFDIDFAKGTKVIGVDGAGGGSQGYSPWKEAGTVDHATINISTDNRWTNPPRFLQYDVLNGHSSGDIIKVDAYKASVVANRRVYLGNIKQDGVIHGDRMLKSPVNQFDKFPSINNIDVAIHDGDDIVALVEYADRILQFKKNTCYIINVSGNSEYLEAEHKFKGITNPGAACRTDYGVAWANQNGCYMYDGQQVTDLLEDQGMRKINQSTWSSFISAENFHRIGFNPFKRQLIVLNGTNDSTVLDDAYVYDMVTKSWTFSANMVADGDTGSNFINDPVDGSLLIYNETGTEIDKWADTPASGAPAIVIATKDIDFGEPAVRKKLYKIYVTYKGDGSGITENYRTNGGTTDYGFTAGFGSVSVWTRLELKPSTTDANDIYSCQLRLTGTCATNFMINDITFVFRQKSIK